MYEASCNTVKACTRIRERLYANLRCYYLEQ